ncbi:MAG: inositol monophosphatase [Planctomycetota bacterium]
MNRRSVGAELAETLATAAREGFAIGVPADDAELEALFRRLIRERTPGDAVLGEEIAETTGWDGRGWIIDPIDGTNNYVGGVPFYCVSIAYFEEAQPRLGWVVDPERRETWFAAAGEGVWCNGKRVAVLEECRSPKPLVMVSSRWRKRHRSAAAKLRDRVRDRTFGALALECAWVAGGRVSAGVWGSARIWDLAAGVLLISEGGGYVESCSGGPLAFSRDGEKLREERISFHGGAPALRELLVEHCRTQ